jgi:hypothetical protein
MECVLYVQQLNLPRLDLLALLQTWDKGITVVALPFLHFLDEHLVFIKFFFIVSVAIRFF